MEAKVQYNDYRGTTAADRCDLFEELPGQMTEIIFEKFQIEFQVGERLEDIDENKIREIEGDNRES